MLTKATIIDLSNHALNEIPESFNLYKNIIELNISNNNLLDLINIFNNSNMVCLDASRNNIVIFNYKIKDLKKLKLLHLAFNKISIIPSQILHLIDLEILILNNNSIQYIPYEIKYLTKLKNCNLSNNKISIIDDSIYHLIINFH